MCLLVVASQVVAEEPLIVGANLPKNDDSTLGLLTNDEVLAVDQTSGNNRQLSRNDDLVKPVPTLPAYRSAPAS